jgi:hypothetical protein
MMSLLVMMRSPCHHRRSNVNSHLREFCFQNSKFWIFQAPSFGFFFNARAWICRSLSGNQTAGHRHWIRRRCVALIFYSSSFEYDFEFNNV